ncbi:hypothetical protein CLOM_g23161, partial [Closterium sp. NIES-68]
LLRPPLHSNAAAAAPRPFARIGSHQQPLFSLPDSLGLSASSPASRSARTPGRGVARRANGVAPRASAEDEEPVTIDNSTVLVVGGGGVGMEVVRQLAKAGSWVTALQRGEKFRKEIEGLGAMLAVGDVMAPGTIEKALRGNTFDAVVSTVGGGLTDIRWTRMATSTSSQQQRRPVSLASSSCPA